MQDLWGADRKKPLEKTWAYVAAEQDKTGNRSSKDGCYL